MAVEVFVSTADRRFSWQKAGSRVTSARESASETKVVSFVLCVIFGNAGSVGAQALMAGALRLCSVVGPGFILKVVQSVMGNGSCHNVLNNQPAITTTLYDHRPWVRLRGRYRDEDH
jgi:hypothetical protein